MLFAVFVQGKPKIMQDLCQCRLLDAMSFGGKGLHQIVQGLGCPSEETHRIPFGLQFLLQIGKPRRVGLHQLFHASPRLADPLSWSIALSCLEFFQASFHRYCQIICGSPLSVAHNHSLHIGRRDQNDGSILERDDAGHSPCATR